MRTIGSKCLTAVIIAFLMSFVELVIAGLPAGHPQSLDRDIKGPLERSLNDAGYNCRYLESCISEYLRDNRHMLTRNIDNQRQVDLVICIMNKKGITSFNQYARSDFFWEWCGEQLLTKKDLPVKKIEKPIINYYTSTRLNMRSSPSKKEDILTVLDNNTELRVFKSDGIWLFIESLKSGKKGWVHGCYVVPFIQASSNRAKVCSEK